MALVSASALFVGTSVELAFRIVGLPTASPTLESLQPRSAQLALAVLLALSFSLSGLVVLQRTGKDWHLKSFQGHHPLPRPSLLPLAPPW